MLSMYEIFGDAAALPPRERKDHLWLCDVLYGVVAPLDYRHIEDFIAGDMMEKIEGRYAEILSECNLGMNEMNFVLHEIHDKLEGTQCALYQLYEAAPYDVDLESYILHRNHQLTSMILDYVFPLNSDMPVRPLFNIAL